MAQCETLAVECRGELMHRVDDVCSGVTVAIKDCQT